MCASPRLSSRASDLSDMYAQTVASKQHRATYKPAGGSTKKSSGVRATSPRPSCHREPRMGAAARHGGRLNSRIGTRPLPSPTPHD